MPKYISGRSKTVPLSQLREDRYRYLSVGESEPNLGDPLVGPSSIGAKPVAAGQQYIMVSVQGQPGERYWIPNQGGIIPGSISVFDEDFLVGGLSKTTQLNIVGVAVTAEQPAGEFVGVPVTTTGNIAIGTDVITGITTTDIELGYIVVNEFVSTGSTVTSLGTNTVGISSTTSNSSPETGISFTFNPEYNPRVDIRVFSPGNDSEVLFNTSGDFSTDSTFTFDSTENLLAAGDRITVGTGGTVITTLGIGSVGIGTTDPISRLHVDGDLKLSGTIIDRLGSSGESGYLLVKESDVFGGLKWTNPNAVQSGAGGTYGQIQYHGSTQLVEGAANFYYDEVNQRVGIGSTQPTQLLDVLGISTFSGGVFIDNLSVSGVSTFTGTIDANGNLDVDGHTELDNLNVSGLSTFTSNVDMNAGLDVDGQTDLDVLNVSETASFTATTDNTLGNVDTGAVQLDGGAGIAKNLTVGQTIQATNLNITGIGTIETFDFGTGLFDNIKVTGISTLGNVVVDTNTISTKSGNLTLDSFAGSVQIAASDTLVINNTTDSNSTITGSFQVSGGAGIVGNLYVGGSIVGTVSTAINLDGGAAGSLPYQSDTGTTTFLADPNQDGFVLTYNDTTEAPEWVDIATLTGVGYTLLAVDSGDNVILRLNDTTKSVNADVLITAGTNITIDPVADSGFTINASDSVSNADNLNGGSAGDIVYQDNENSTTFLADPGSPGNGYVLTWDNPNLKPKWSDLTTLSGAGYTFFAVDSGDNVILRLSDGSTNDDVTITAGNNITIDPVAEGGFTISASNNVGAADTATNLAGGTAGDLVYQNGPGITTFLADPGESGNGYVLTWNNSETAPQWSNLTTLSGAGYTFGAVDSGDNVILRLSDGSTNDDVTITAGNNITIDPVAEGGFTISASNNVGAADTATDLAGGAKGSLPYQDDPGSTVFLAEPNGDGYVLTYNNGSDAPQWSELNSLSGAGYTFFAVDSGNNVILRLSDGSTDDDVTITAGNNITIDPVAEGGFTISATAGAGADFSGLEVYEENTSVGTGFTALKFIGSSITALNGGGGIANVSIAVTYGDVGNTPTIPTDISELNNDVGFITSGSLVGYATEGYVDSAVAGVSTFSGDYNDLSNKPTIPTDTSDLTNNAGFITGITVKNESGNPVGFAGSIKEFDFNGSSGVTIVEKTPNSGIASILISGGSGGSSTFLGLTDTPGSFTPSKFLAVNSGGTAVEFVDAPSGGDVGIVTVKQENYTCTNPITSETVGSATTITITENSNAYGKRYIQTTDPASGGDVCDGDIWYDTTPSSGSPSSPSSNIVLATPQTATGTEVAFTGIPSWAKRITIMFNLVSLDSGADFQIQLGTSSAYINSGYTARTQEEDGVPAVTINTTAFIIYNGGSSSSHCGKFEIDKFSDTAYTFIGQTTATDSSATQAYGVLNSISGTIDRLRILPTSGNFDGGSINISYE